MTRTSKHGYSDESSAYEEVVDRLINRFKPTKNRIKLKVRESDYYLLWMKKSIGDFVDFMDDLEYKSI